MLGKCKQPEQASLLFEVMLSEGLRPTLDVYTALVSAYGHSGQLDKSIFTVTYNTIIDGYGKADMFELMESSLTEMIESGTCLPDIFTLNSFIWAYGNSGQIEKMEKWVGNIEKMEEFFLKMKHQGVKPNSITYCSLVSAYSKAGAYGQAGDVERMGELFWYEREEMNKVDRMLMY
ncbi:Pentatricopeptide repeat-containing protein [Vitis vinifera]|uniref:Pentatricopeptide repeat-containing protein n=1 Tax=Vitis vinifera TaxID=29760 RepID=A0A438IVA4_VITVI|nr:Pentatricopeptide repeat-containing protein [Vitis vinifera]